MSSASEVTDEGLFVKEGRSLGGEVKDGMFHAVAGWLEKQGKPDVYKERMAMFQRIHDALPPGKLKEIHEMGRGFAEFDARVAGWSAEGKVAVWTLAKDVIAAEFPPVLLLPNNAPSIIDAWSARASGFIGEKAIQGTVAAGEGIKGVRGRIDSAMTSILSGSAMRIAPVGGAA